VGINNLIKLLVIFRLKIKKNTSLGSAYKQNMQWSPVTSWPVESEYINRNAQNSIIIILSFLYIFAKKKIMQIKMEFYDFDFSKFEILLTTF
jgi:hypothetical protein